MGGNETFIKRLDPRVKFFCLTLCTLQIFAFTSAIPMISASVVLLVAALAERISPLFLLKRITSISFFIILTIGIHMFTTSGGVLFEFRGLYATHEGLNRGAVLSVRLILLVLAATLFLRTTSTQSMVDGIETTLRPVRKQCGPVIQVLTIAMNFVPLLIKSSEQIKKAQMARGAKVDKNIMKQLQFAFSAIIPLYAMTFRSSEQLALAMESRCYNPLASRSQYSQLTLVVRDRFVLILMIVQCVVSIAVTQ
jgi:energy-coupling factor transport system permease protein